MKQVFKLVNLFLVVLLLSFTSCTNDLSEKNPEISFSFELPQERINRATNENSDNTLWNINAQIENTKEIIQKIEKTAYSGETVTLTFKEIIVGQEVKINIDLTKKDEKTQTYTGSSDWFIVKNGNNKINIKLNKIIEITPEVNDATIPEIITQPQSIVEIATPNSTTITKTLSLSAKSTDGGTLSFIWQEKNPNNTWQKFEPITTTPDSDRIKSSIEVTVEKGNSKTFKCIITNTNNSVNGNKTATIETNEVTVAYVEGALTSITAQYKGEYETFGSNFTYGKVTVTETYTSGTNNQTSITFDASENRYDIQKVNNDEKAIGYVPYTVSCISSTNITTNLTVPVKYQLNANDFVITGSNQNNGNQEKIAQFTGNTTLEVVTSEASNVPSKIYENKDENSATAEDYEILQNLQSVWKLENQQIRDTAVNNAVAKTYQYTNTLTVPTENSWCVGDPIELEYEVEVCPWKIALNTENGNTVDLNNLTEKTNYTLSATNEADENPNVTWESSDSSVFSVSGSTLTTPTATTSDQTATITAKVDGKVIGSVEVTVQKQEPLGSEGNPFTNWTDLCEYLSESLTDDTTIYVQGEEIIATETATVNRPVTIIPVGEVTITLDENFSEQLFTVNADLTLKGDDASNQLTIDGNLNKLEYPLISTDNSNITLEYVTMQNYTNSPESNYNPAGGAISFNGTIKTLSLKNCNFTNVVTTITPNEEFKTPIGAIYFGNGYLILDNCSFTNASPDYVDLYCYPDDTSKITLKDNITLPIIQYANAFTSYFGDLQITLEDTFQSDEIKIYVDNIIDGYDTKLFTLNGAELPNCFTLLNDGYEFNTEGIIVEKTTGGSGGTQLSGTLVKDETELLNAISGNAEIIIIENNITITECIDISNPVQIAANTDVTITSNLVSDYMFYLYSNLTLGGGSGTLTITGPNHEIALIGTNSATKTITINNGVKFTNCSYYCLSLTGKDTLEINGGEFSSNTMAPIAIASSNTSAVINMSGGKIENNSATNIAAGIVVNNGTLNITGGTLQNNKLNETDSGASIYVSTYGNATIEQTNTTLSKNAHYKKAIINGVEQ